MELVKTTEYPYGEYDFERFNPVQSGVFQHIEQDCNLVVSSPTASGKTICGEMVAGKAVANGTSVVYLSPLKALAEEKYRDWSSEDHPWAQYKKCILTGDYRLTDKKKRELEAANIVISTYEMMAVRCRNHKTETSNWLTSIGVLIVDEAHFISSEGRGDHLEHALMLFGKINPKARIVFLSATMKNHDEMVSWVSKLNGMGTEVVVSDYRPCKLNLNFIGFQASYGQAWKAHEANQMAVTNALLTLLEKFPKEQWLVFVHTKGFGYKLLQLLSPNYRVGFHCADHDKLTRDKLETNFKNGKLRVLLATSTLAYGMNLPARRVAICGIKRGFDFVDVLDIIQECGRAGRPKYDTEGDAYVILPANEMMLWAEKIKNGIRVESQMWHKVGFHLIGEVAEKRVTTLTKAREWYRNSLAFHQGLTSADVVEGWWKTYIDNYLMRPDDFENSAIHAVTTLGRIASRNYFNPLDVVAWKNNISRVRQRDLMRNDAAIAWFIANIPNYHNNFVPKEMRGAVQDFLLDFRTYKLGGFCSDGALAVGAMLYSRMRQNDDVLRGFGPLLAAMVSDCDRIISCLHQLDSWVLSNKDADYWTRLHKRIKYGVSWEAADLCRIPGVGRVYSHVLVNMGIRSVAEFYNRFKSLRGHLPKAVMRKALKAKKKLLGEE